MTELQTSRMNFNGVTVKTTNRVLFVEKKVFYTNPADYSKLVERYK